MHRALLIKLLLTFLLLPLIIIASANILILSTAQGQVFSEASAITPGRIGLVLGCPPTVTSGKPNIYFEQRMDAAAHLIHNSIISTLLVSGATDGGSYNEPRAMQKALLKRGVRSQRFSLDDQGNRTFDSLLHIKKRYNNQPIIIITQRAHARRALFIARHLGIDAIAFNAETLGFKDTIVLTLRESLARVRAILDVLLLRLD